MKKLWSKLFVAGLLGLCIISCDDDTEVVTPPTPESGYDAVLYTNDPDSLTATVNTDDIEDGKVDIKLTLEAEETIRRVYITQNVFGQGEEIVDVSALFAPQTFDTKGDKSIDVTNGLDSVTYFLSIDIEDALPEAQGTIVYKFWGTKNKGDFRDDSKDLLGEVAELTLILKTRGTSNAEVKEFTGIKLYPPSADLTSPSFVSTADGVIYSLDDFENSDLWDIGYTAQGNTPRLTSAFASPQRFNDGGVIKSFQELVEEKTGATDLNAVYFTDIADDSSYDLAKNSSDLASLSVSTSDPETIVIDTDVKGDLVAFVDQYGKKGIIRIVKLFDGNGNGFYYDSSADYVEIDIKVQP